MENPDECINLVSQSYKHFGRLDGLVNSAAVTTRGTLEDTTVKLWDQHMAINVRAPFLTMKEAVKIMQKQGRGGSIVNIITKSAHGVSHFDSVFHLKRSIGHFNKKCCCSQRWHKIKVNGIMVGWMDTPAEDMIQRKFHGAQGDWLEDVESKQPLGKLAKPDEVADLVALMAQVTGVV